MINAIPIIETELLPENFCVAMDKDFKVVAIFHGDKIIYKIDGKIDRFICGPKFILNIKDKING